MPRHYQGIRMWGARGHWRLLSILLAAGSSAAEAAGQTDAAASQVETREVAFAKTMADRDFRAFLTFISPEAVFFNGDEALRGRDEIARAWEPLFVAPVAPFSWHPDVVQVLESGGLALTSGPVLDPTGAEVGRFNSIWRRDADGQWRVVFDKGS